MAHCLLITFQTSTTWEKQVLSKVNLNLQGRKLQGAAMKEMNYVMPGRMLERVKEVNFASLWDGYIKQQEGWLRI